MAVLTLASVQRDFKVWRSTRAKMERIPDHLWDKVLRLLKNNPVGAVASALGLSGGQIYSRRKNSVESQHMQAQKQLTTEFVEFDPAHLATPYINNIASTSTRVEIRRANGTALLMENLSEQTIFQVLSYFIPVVH